jgi:MoxR-like ATPase
LVAPATSAAPALQDKFDLLGATLNQEMVERRQEIDTALNALVAGVHVFYLGTPGTAKSMMVDRLNAYIGGARVFKILMSRFTTPDEVFGPVSLAGLKDDRFERRIEGYLADAELVFLDEGFKSNSSVLNALLWAINERIYRHGTNVVHTPLSTLFLASNELPQDESLGALYDRLLFRFEVKKVRDQASFVRMIRTVRPESPDPILTWDEVEIAKAEARSVIIPDEVVNAVADLRKKLAEAGIEPTDRRFVEALKIVRAAAWLDGCAQADTEHLRPLQHVFWEVPEQAATVSKVVLAIANPMENEALSLLAELDKLEESLNKLAGDDDKQRKGAELHGKLRKAKKELDALKKRAGSGRRRTGTLNEIQHRLTILTERVLEEVFKIDPSEGVATS